MIKPLDDKTLKEAIADSEAKPWWVLALQTEVRRARKSEGLLLEAVEAMAEELSGWSDEAPPGLASAMTALARMAMVTVEKARGQ